MNKPHRTSVRVKNKVLLVEVDVDMLLLFYMNAKDIEKFVSGCLVQLATIVDAMRVMLAEPMFLCADLLIFDLVSFFSSQPFCLAVAITCWRASSAGLVVLKQRVVATGGGFKVSSSLSTAPRNSMPSQVAEYMGSLRMKSRCPARAEQPVRSRQAHRIKVVTVVVVRWCIIAFACFCRLVSS